MADVYDGAFKTIINDCNTFILPFIKEVFGDEYDGNERIEFHANEHFINQQNEPDKKRITDTNFTVLGKSKKKYHLECESSTYTGRILVRLFEYDAQIALDEGETGKNYIKVTFPNTAVLYLRCNGNTPEKMRIIIEVPGDRAEYDVKTVKIINYPIEDIFEKKLYLLIPFYIFTYESQFEECEKDKDKLSGILSEYKKIVARLDELTRKGEMTSFDKRTIMELSGDVIKELTKKYINVQKEVGDFMVGAMIETEARRIRDEGISQGLSQGILSTVKVCKKFGASYNQTVNQIMEDYGFDEKKAKEETDKYWKKV